ncbi:Protein GVQW3 [Varanus komodoensis]|nr:Protein GVQW3 [Varanus komodoensis]
MKIKRKSISSENTTMMTDATMLKKTEHRAVIKFLTKQGKSQKIIHEEMVAVYQDSAPSLSTVQKWSSEFKRDRESTEDDPHSGRPVTATTKENVKKIEKLILEDARIKIKTLAEMTNLSVGTIFAIFHDHLNLSKVCARWVPRMLMVPQKQVRVECCREFLELCGEGPLSIFDWIVTGDETWVHHYDPESKKESMQWHKKGADPPKKFKITPSARNIMATVFWDSKGILLIE